MLFGGWKGLYVAAVSSIRIWISSSLFCERRNDQNVCTTEETPLTIEAHETVAKHYQFFDDQPGEKKSRSEIKAGDAHLESNTAECILLRSAMRSARKNDRRTFGPGVERTFSRGCQGDFRTSSRKKKQSIRCIMDKGRFINPTEAHSKVGWEAGKCRIGKQLPVSWRDRF